MIAVGNLDEMVRHEQHRRTGNLPVGWHRLPEVGQVEVRKRERSVGGDEDARHLLEVVAVVSKSISVSQLPDVVC
jgi:hypothetical protein